MDLQVEHIVRECVECSVSDKTKKVRSPPMVCREVLVAPWEKVALNILGPVSVGSWPIYLLVLTDMFSNGV